MKASGSLYVSLSRSSVILSAQHTSKSYAKLVNLRTADILNPEINSSYELYILLLYCNKSCFRKFQLSMYVYWLW